MAIPIIDSLLLPTDLPLDSRYSVDSIYDVSQYWHAGMQHFDSSVGRVKVVVDPSTEEIRVVAWIEDVSTSLGNYVLKTGDTMTGQLIIANGGLDVSNGGITRTGYIDFQLDPSLVHEEGRLRWDDNDKTLLINTEVTGVSLQIGQENYIRVRNISGSTILNGSAVYVNGSSGNRPTIELAIANDPSTSTRLLGLTTHDILDGANGYVTTFGIVRDLNTSAYLPGDLIYLSPSVLGGITNVIPNAPNCIVKIGTVLISNPSAGTILVNISSPKRLSFLSDVSARGFQQNNDTLLWNDAGDFWKPFPIINYIDGSLFARDISINYLNNYLTDLSAYVNSTFLRESSLGLDFYFDASSNLNVSIPPRGTSFPTIDVSQGDLFYRTDLDHLFNFDGSRNKWLSTDRSVLSSGNLSINRNTSGYMIVGNAPQTSTEGFVMWHNGCITAASIDTGTTMAAAGGRDLQIRVNNSATYNYVLNIPNGAKSNYTENINLDVSMGDRIQAILIANGTDNTSNIIVNIEVAGRA